MTIATIQTECGFEEAWIGKCKQIGDPRCPKHTGRKCVSCGAEATHDCEETGQFVCGENLCDDCEHTIFPSGTNGGIGFNAESLPEGMKRHCRKTEQKFKPWYAREDDTEHHNTPAAPERGERDVDLLVSLAARNHVIYDTELSGKLLAISGEVREQHSTLVTQRERLLAALRQARNAAVVFADSRNLSTARSGLQSIVSDIDEVITTSEQDGREG